MAKQELRGERNWYAIHTYAGYENAVMRNLKQRIDSLGVNDKIFSVVVPTVERGFLFEDFELADRHELTRQFPQHRKIIEKLTPGEN